MYLDSVRELLRKQKLVEGLTRAQAGAHPPALDMVTEKQQPPPVELYGSRERHPKSSTRAERCLVHRHLRFPTSAATLSRKAQPS